ncbi:TPA: ANR family transcriptional regulator [Salmonella enterica subsp. enterica serovar Concord]|nr:ANR family transcriptional regulator [Salmonella enterica subsp. enterica serovar Concord]
MQHSSLILMRKEIARRAAQAERSQDYATARALWHQVYAASATRENTLWAAARMQFCERQLYHLGTLTHSDPGQESGTSLANADPEK